MRIHRIHTPATLEPGSEARLEGDPAHYLGRVLRATAGQTVVLFNGDGQEYVSEIVRLDKRNVVLRVDSRLPGIAEPELQITVVQAVSRGERMDQTLQKCTELGAAAFQPVFSERVEVRLKGEKAARRLAHWRGVVVSACEQSGRSVVPPVHETRMLRQWLDHEGESKRLVLTPDADQRLSDTGIGPLVQLVVGPEGGFSAAELDLMTAKGVQPVCLGPRILRTETAAPAAVAIMLALTEGNETPFNRPVA